MVWDVEFQRKVRAAEHDALGQFLVRVADNSFYVDETSFSAYVRAYCERGRLSARRFLLTSDGNRASQFGETVTIRENSSYSQFGDTCFSVLFRFFPDAAYVCLGHPFIAAVVNHVTRVGEDVYTAWLPRWCSGKSSIFSEELASIPEDDSISISEARARVLRRIVKEVPLCEGAVNAITTDDSDDRHRLPLLSSSTLTLLIGSGMAEEAEVFLRRYGSVLTDSVLNRGSCDGIELRRNQFVNGPAMHVEWNGRSHSGEWGHAIRYGRSNTPLGMAVAQTRYQDAAFNILNFDRLNCTLHLQFLKRMFFTW